MPDSTSPNASPPTVAGWSCRPRSTCRRLDLLHPHLFRGDAQLAGAGTPPHGGLRRDGWDRRRGPAPRTSRRARPAFGEHIAWAESNAIVFANSVLGARTDRYGDFIDICAAITGRVPDAGLHRDEHRRARIVFRLDGIADAAARLRGPVSRWWAIWSGRRTGTRVPAIVGLPTDAPEDASRHWGGRSLVGRAWPCSMPSAGPRRPPPSTTPSAAPPPEREIVVDQTMLDRAARDELTTRTEGPLSAVSVGTPHFSLAEFRTAGDLFAGRTRRPGRRVLREHLAGHPGRRPRPQDWSAPLRQAAGVEIVTDTCTYITPIMRDRRRGGHDQLREDGLLRPRQPRRRRRLRQPGTTAWSRRSPGRITCDPEVWAMIVRALLVRHRQRPGPWCSTSHCPCGADSTRRPARLIDRRHPQSGAIVTGIASW